MICVFEASSGLEAHMILNLLEQAGIHGRIEGEYLQGGVGELQAMNYVRVLVAEGDIDESRKIISDWESVQPSPETGNREQRSPAGIRSFMLGVAFGACATYLMLKLRG